MNLRNAVGGAVLVAATAIGSVVGTAALDDPVVVAPPDPHSFHADAWECSLDHNPAAPESAYMPDDCGGIDTQIGHRGHADGSLPTETFGQHDEACNAPPSEHQIFTYEDSVYFCRNHMMTALNTGDSYAATYLTFPVLADWSVSTSTIRWAMSTARNSDRDWITLTLQPYENNLAQPLESWIPDYQGMPSQYIQIRMDQTNSNCTIMRIQTQTMDYVSGLCLESVVTPSFSVRSQFELQVSPGHLKFWMPEHNAVFADIQIDDPGFDQGIVQLSHHSYNPTKGSGMQGNPAVATTWHWDNFYVDGYIPLKLIHADKRIAFYNESVTFDEPAPPDAVLRFTAISKPRVSIDGGPFIAATRAQFADHPEHVSTWYVDMPEGTTQAKFVFDADGWFGCNYQCFARDFGIWSQDTQEVPPSPTSTATPTLPSPTSTNTPVPTPSPSPTATSIPVATSTPTPTIPAPTATPSSTPSLTSTASPTDTKTPTMTSTPSISSPTPTITSLPPTATASPVSTPTATSTSAPPINCDQYRGFLRWLCLIFTRNR